MKRLCIIPARGGSKRIPRKNVRSFLGKPIIAYAIDTAINSGCFDEVMVSTDDFEIADVARKYGALVPFMRNSLTANDYATTAAVLIEVLHQYELSGHFFCEVCCLYPTAVLTTSQDLRDGLAKLEGSKFNAVLPVCRFDYPIWRSLNRSNEGRITLNWPEYRDTRSQDLPTMYHDVGQWCWFLPDVLKREGSLLGQNTGSILVSPDRVQDIDTEEDWCIAELKFKRTFK